METNQNATEIVAPSLSTSFAHFMLGLNVGLAVYALYLWFFVGCQLHGKPTNQTWEAVYRGLLLPIALSGCGIELAWWRPCAALKSVSRVMGLLCLGVLLALGCLFIFTMIAFSGYC